MGIVANDILRVVGETKTIILNGINIRIDDGEFVSIVGKSGSGKSSLLYCLSSLDRPDKGIITIDDQDIYQVSESDLNTVRNNKIGFIFQFHFLLPELSALENVLLPSTALGSKKKDKSEKAYELLRIVGLKGKEHRLPRELSGGEQQRVAIARAFINDPKYVFADEPTGALDTKNGEAVMDLIEGFNQERKTTVVFVTHDMEFAKKAKRTITLKDGIIENEKNN